MWKKVEYTKREINDAGSRIVQSALDDIERKECIKIIDNWRAAHAFPMNTFAIHLKHIVSQIPEAIVVQRLKRLNTIIYKLNRFPDMKLFRMQDLGGCRVILPTINDVYDVISSLRNSRIRHIEHNYKDYIAIPNPNTGYRGYHLIYRYKSDRREDYNGLQVEIQVRTQLQHLWATAVETVGVFTNNGLKFNQGSERWLLFFRLVSALFSLEEKSAIVDGISNEPSVIVRQLAEIMSELHVVDKLYTIGLATEEIGHINRTSKRPGYYLLILDIDNSQLQVKKYKGVEKGLDLATEDYNKIEKVKDRQNIDAVLVSAMSYETLVYAYPNYFANIKDFTKVLIDLMEKYQSK